MIHKWILYFTKDKKDWGEVMLHGVISTYNNKPTNIIKFFKSYSIYDQSSDTKLAKELLKLYPNITVTKNSGHSLSHYFAYIIENYEKLPVYIVFLKSNVVPRHIDLDTFERCMEKATIKSGYISFFNDENFRDKVRVAYHIYPGLFLERNNSWYMKRMPTRYFSNFNQLLEFVFKNPKIPEFVPFTPGACFGISASHIQKIPLEVWKFLELITTYSYFPSEAYLVERFLFILFHAPYEFQPYFLEENPDWRLYAEQLQVKVLESLECQTNKNRTRNCKNLVYSMLVKIESKLRYELDLRF